MGPAAGGTALAPPKCFAGGKTLVRGNLIAPNRIQSGVPAKGSAFCGAGQNARLAAKLTGWKIDIKPASAPADEEVEDEEDVILEDEAEE